MILSAVWLIAHFYVIVAILYVLIWITFIQPIDGVRIDVVVNTIILSAILWPVSLYFHYCGDDEEDDEETEDKKEQTEEQDKQ